MKTTSIRIAVFGLSLLIPSLAFSQDPGRDLDGKEYIIVKDFKPTLSESRKVTGSPSGDTTTFRPAVMEYPFIARKADTYYETAAISAVKIKDEPLAKLYRCYLKAGGGNYSKYLGELYVNSLRSKKGAIGLTARHLSGDPTFKGFNNAAYSSNTGKLDGMYFIEHARLDGAVDFDRQAVRYYAVPDTDSILSDSLRQRYVNIAAHVGISSTVTDSAQLHYTADISYSSLTADFGASETEFRINGGFRKRFNELLGGVDLDVDVFTKKDEEAVKASNSLNLDRNIIRVNPYVASHRDRILFKAGAKIEYQTNEETDLHFFPQLDLRVPVSEGVLSVFASVDGGLEKNNYHTVTTDNPFVDPLVLFKNTIRMIDIVGGINGNISDAFSFIGRVGYASYRDMQLYAGQPSRINTFTLIYDDASRFNLHGELCYRSSEKLGVSLQLDQFSYKMDLQKYAYYRPSTVATLKADYNLKDKILVKAALFGIGGRYGVEVDTAGAQTYYKLKPYIDANLGLEYRYSKILSAFVNFNNVGFAKFQQWYGYPMERLNVMGGITYSF
ncbi:MAG: hypothetical protein ACKO1U_05750 [Bacteroidota bacterium]